MAFHGVHGILATHPLKRLKHAARIYVAAPEDPKVPHIGFIPASSVEDAITDALKHHGPAGRIACLREPQGL